MRPQIPRLEDYGLSPVHGFLPSEFPLDRLPNSYYNPWEAVISNLQGLLLSGRIHRVVDTLPVLSTEFLTTEPEWRRAYMLLAFLSHAYIWGGDTPRDIVPPPLSTPFLTTCTHLAVPPVATYAAVTLWNWRPLFAAEPPSLSNLMTLHTFTGASDESWFYLVSVAIEARAAPILPSMLAAMAAAQRGDAGVVTACLREFAERLDELGALLGRMDERCDPHVFYHRIRPFLAGSRDMRAAGLPRGVLFDTGADGGQEFVQFAGGSNAQSSIVQFFDLVLGVVHHPTGARPCTSTSSTTASSSPPSGEEAAGPPNFITAMRAYMPGPHRAFLAAVGRAANIREFVESNRSDRALTTAYDACLAMLRAFRDRHIQMVSRYIIVKSREVVAAAKSGASMAAHTHTPAQKVNLASATLRSGASGGGTGGSGGGGGGGGGLRGTGGTALIPFLKQARDETGEPAIDAWARRLLNDGPGGRRRGRGAGWADGKGREGEVEIVGLAGKWSVDDSEGGICHW